MKVKFGSIVVDGRGKIGGHVASKNAAGNYFRTKVTPSNPQTPAQQAVRAALAANSKAYQTLTEAQRDSFIEAAKEATAKNIFGDGIKLSGINLFTRLNNNLSLIGVANITSAPAPVSIEYLPITAAAVAKGADTATVTFSGAQEVGTHVVIRATAGLSAGKNFVKSEYRIIGTIDDVLETPYDVKALYVAKFGEIPAAGKKIFFESYVIDDATGYASQRATFETIVSA